MATRIHSNNYLTTLNGSITAIATSIVVSSVTNFPVIGAGVTCNLTIQNGSSIEIINVTSNSGTTLTVVRGFEGTSGLIFPSGSTISLRPTADSIDRKLDLGSYTTTATAAGTTTLTVASNYLQFFTGSTTQTVILPVVSTLRLGQQFTIYNNSSGVVTVQSSGANSIQAMAAGTKLLLTAILITGTTAASWYAEYDITSPLVLPLSLANGGTASSLTASNGGIVYSDVDDLEILSGTATAGLPLISGSSMAPTWGTLNGSGNIVATTSPALVTPALGTVASGVISTCTSTSMVMVTPVLGTPTSGNLSNCTAYAQSALTGLGTGVSTFLGTPTSANLISAITDETGTGALVFANTPTLIAPLLGTVTSGDISACTSTSMVMVTPVLGVPTSGTLTNCTGLPVAGGGTGIATQTAYSVLVGGTTATGAMQSLASIGTINQVLTSQGAGALPIWSTLATPVTGPGSATDKAIAIFNGTGGSTIQNSTITISASNTISLISALKDTGGNQSIGFTATGSAVNYVNITNGATGTGPIVAPASGTDTNIQLTLQGAGTKGVVIAGTTKKLTVNAIDIWVGSQAIATNTGVGTQALQGTNNASSTNNTGFGYLAGNAITTGASNTVVGASAGGALASGGDNTFIGYSSGGATNGSSGALAGNSGATGGVALSNSGGASDNTLLGYRATCDTSSAVGCLALGEDAVAAKATGTTSITIGPGIAIGSAARPVGFAGDGTMIQTAGSSSGYWRVKVNGTHYKILMFADS